jgi:hypothetical protein
MTLDPKKQAELLRATKGAAAALIEDFQYIREVVAKGDPTNADIRRVSALLRRIIVEPDLVAISAPRLGKIKLIGPDNNSAYRAERGHPFLVFVSGRAKIMGAWSSTLAAFDVKGPCWAPLRLRAHHHRIARSRELLTATKSEFITRSIKALTRKLKWIRMMAGDGSAHLRKRKRPGGAEHSGEVGLLTF